jgi:hypothetical protein
MPNDIDKIVDGFPHPTIAPITGVPNYETLANLNLQLNANAASVQSNLGDGLLGLLYLTVTPTEYNTLSNVAFGPPDNPAGAIPEMGANATGAQIAAVVCEHNTRINMFKEYLATDKVLKQHVLGAVNNMYLRTLQHRITGFANVTMREMLDHLYTNYGRLSPADLQENDTCLHTPYDPNQPIEAFIDQVEDAVSLAAAAQAPYSPQQTIAMAYTLMFSTGMFPEACQEWRRRPTAKQTWVNFKTAFTEAHQDFRDSQVTSKQTCYHHQANVTFELQHDTAKAIANLETATALDHATVANFTTTNSKLTIDLAQAIQQLTLAQADLTSIKVKLATMQRGANGSNNTTNQHAYSSKESIVGCTVTRSTGTTTAKCAKTPVKDTGHKTGATRRDNQGGSQKGKE